MKWHTSPSGVGDRFGLCALQWLEAPVFCVPFSGLWRCMGDAYSLGLVPEKKAVALRPFVAGGITPAPGNRTGTYRLRNSPLPSPSERLLQRFGRGCGTQL